MKRILLTLCLALVVVLALSLSVGAKEYTVSSADEFNTAYASAVDGDTIIITQSISATHDFGKSITYILDGDGIVWTAGAQCSETGKAITIYSRNGSNSFKPNSGMWCNSYAVTVKDFSSTTWTFGGEEATGTITLDLSACNTRLFYDVTLKEFNFRKGSIVANCPNTSDNNTFYIRATTVNIYDGAKICGNEVAAYRAFFQTNTLNIYGGEIYGNYFKEYGMLVSITGTPTINMFGGEIHDIYLSFSNTGVTEGLFKNATFNMYGGSIHDIFVKGANPSVHSALAGTKSLVAGNISELYYFSSWTAPTRVNGLFVAELDTSSATEITSFPNSTTYFSHSIMFKNTDSSIISAFMIKDDGSIHKSTTGATEFSVPSAFDFWKASADAGCADAISSADVKSTAQASLYGASHTLGGTKISYPNGFDKAGMECKPCTGEGCSYCVVLTDGLNPIVTALGYSVRLDTSRGYGIAGGYKVDYDAIDAYEKANGVVIEIGIIMMNPEFQNGSTFFTNGKLTVSSKALQISSTSNRYSHISFMINGFDNTMLDLDLIISSYITERSGEENAYTYQTSFVQVVPESPDEDYTFEKADGTLYSVCCNMFN